MPRQRLSSTALLDFRFLRLLFFFGGRLGIRFFLFLRLIGLPESFEQRQLIFRELLALAVAVRNPQLAPQNPVRFHFRSLVLQPFAQLGDEFLQLIDVPGQRVGIDSEHERAFRIN
jgi:hypothetical protein